VDKDDNDDDRPNNTDNIMTVGLYDIDSSCGVPDYCFFLFCQLKIVVCIETVNTYMNYKDKYYIDVNLFQ